MASRPEALPAWASVSPQARFDHAATLAPAAETPSRPPLPDWAREGPASRPAPRARSGTRDDLSDDLSDNLIEGPAPAATPAGRPEVHFDPAASGWTRARALLGLALPMSVSRLGLAAMGLVDGVMLAHHDVAQLAYHDLADALSGRGMEVGMAFVMAGLALATQVRSAGGPGAGERIASIWRQALMLAVLAGGLGLLLAMLSGPLLQLLRLPPAVALPSAPVLAILLLGMPAALAAIASAAMLEAMGRPLAVVVLVLLANGLNVGLNLLLIDGVAGGPPLGAQGVAWSTTLVRTALAVALLLWARRLSVAPGLDLSRWPVQADWHAGGEQRARGRSAAANVGLLALIGLGLPTFAGWLGTEAMAAFTALFLVLAPMMVVGWGFVDAGGLHMAAAWGRERGSGQLMRLGRQLTLTLLAALLLMALLVLALPEALLRQVVPDAALRGQVVALLPWGLALAAAEALCFFAANLLRSVGVLRRPLLIQVAGAVLALAASAALGLGLNGGLAGLLIGQSVLTACRALILLAMLDGLAHRADRRHAQKRALADEAAEGAQAVDSAAVGTPPSGPTHPGAAPDRDAASPPLRPQQAPPPTPAVAPGAAHPPTTP